MRYQWFRDGKKIPLATEEAYVMTAEDTDSIIERRSGPVINPRLGWMATGALLGGFGAMGAMMVLVWMAAQL